MFPPFTQALKLSHFLVVTLAGLSNRNVACWLFPLLLIIAYILLHAQAELHASIRMRKGDCTEAIYFPSLCVSKRGEGVLLYTPGFVVAWG